MFNDNDHVFIPDNLPIDEALKRTTALCFSAHQDDIEFMAYNGIVECFNKEDKWFTGCVVTDGAGSPRAGLYADFTNEDMKEVRKQEQDKAAKTGGYAAQIQLGFASSQVKSCDDDSVVKNIAEIILKCKPEIIYTHNLADKHDTHVAVALRVISAIRSLDEKDRPKKLYGMEVWRGLDWLNDNEKVVFDASTHPNLAVSLMGVYDSQISGGKRYDLAVAGRRAANATFFESHGTDEMTDAIYAIDLSELIGEGTDPATCISQAIDRFKEDVINRVCKFANGEIK